MKFRVVLKRFVPETASLIVEADSLDDLKSRLGEVHDYADDLTSPWQSMAEPCTQGEHVILETYSPSQTDLDIRRKLNCPKCGNGINDKGIFYVYAEFRIQPVVDVRDGKIICNYDDNDFADPNGKLTMPGVNTPEKDLSHYRCHGCGHNWYDPRPRLG